MISKYLIFLVCLSCSFYGNSQCSIPNGDFENFYEDTAGFEPYIPFYFPDDWIESVVPNVFTRAIHGEGFYYKYDEPDANGNALQIKRGVEPIYYGAKNNGYIRFNCTEVPEKITGRYKFSGSNYSGITDTLKIASYFKSVNDTLVTIDEHFANLPDDAVILNITETTSNFTDFELDMTSFTGDNLEFVTIQLIMLSGSSDPLNPGISDAVLDDLQFEYNSLSNEEIELEKNPFAIYPNPAQNELYIKNKGGTKIKSLQLFDLTGRVMLHKTNMDNPVQSLNISHLAKGVYLLNLLTDEKEIHTYKIIKE